MGGLLLLDLQFDVIFQGDFHRGFDIDGGVDVGHHALLEQVLENVGGLDAGGRGEALDGDGFLHLDLAAGLRQAGGGVSGLLALAHVAAALLEEAGRALEAGVELFHVRFAELGRAGGQGIGGASTTDVALLPTFVGA